MEATKLAVIEVLEREEQKVQNAITGATLPVDLRERQEFLFQDVRNSTRHGRYSVWPPKIDFLHFLLTVPTPHVNLWPMSEMEFTSVFHMSPDQLLELSNNNLVVLSVYERRPEAWENCWGEMLPLLKSERTISGGLRNERLYSVADSSFPTKVDRKISEFEKYSKELPDDVRDGFGFSSEHESAIRALGFRYMFLKARYSDPELCDLVDWDIRHHRVAEAFERLNFYHAMLTKPVTGSEGGDYIADSSAQFEDGPKLDPRFTSWQPKQPFYAKIEPAAIEWLTQKILRPACPRENIGASAPVVPKNLFDHIVTRDDFESDKEDLTKGLERLSVDLRRVGVTSDDLEKSANHIDNILKAQNSKMDETDRLLGQVSYFGAVSGLLSLTTAVSIPSFYAGAAGLTILCASGIADAIRKFQLPDRLALQPYRHHKLISKSDDILLDRE